MGRHSAPDDDSDDVVVAEPTVATRPGPGRHAQPDDDEPHPAVDTADRAPTTPLPSIDEEPREAPLADQVTERLAVPQSVPAPAASKRPSLVGKGNQSTAADLALLREHSDVRARVIAAVVAPFVIYTVVLYLAAAMDRYFIWVWLPLVGAGILAGGILDAAHRRRRKPPSPS